MTTSKVADPNPSVPQAGQAGVPEAARLPFDAPWGWLDAGWRDMWTIPSVSLGYGAIFSLISAVLVGGLYAVGMHSLFLALAGGFMLIGPVVAMGLYEASRRLALGMPVRFGDVACAGQTCNGQLGFMGVIVLFMLMVWVQLAFLLLMLFMGGAGLPPPSEFMQTLLFTPRGLGLLIVGTIVGGMIAAAVFAVTAMSVPMLLDRQIDAVSAGRASIMAVLKNPKPMALWAALIVVLIGAGIATLLVGLIVAFPLIGHATWHAYRETFPQE